MKVEKNKQFEQYVDSKRGKQQYLYLRLMESLQDIYSQD